MSNNDTFTGRRRTLPSFPDEAFTLLWNETRIKILQVLWEIYDPHVDENAVSSSDLYERVGLAEYIYSSVIALSSQGLQMIHDQHSALPTNGDHHRGLRAHD